MTKFTAYRIPRGFRIRKIERKDFILPRLKLPAGFQKFYVEVDMKTPFDCYDVIEFTGKP